VSLTLLLQQLLNGLSIGSVYAIFALGYTLVFSILGIINFTHGAIFTLGAYLSFAIMGERFGLNGLLANTSLADLSNLPGLGGLVTAWMGVPPQLRFSFAVLGGSILAGFAGVGIERIAFRPLRQRGSDPLLTVVSSLGVAVVIINVIQFLVGAESYTFPSQILGNWPAALNFGSSSQPIPIRTIQLLIFAVAIVILSGLTWVINGSRYGKAMRAVAEDTTTASLLGIPVDTYIVGTFFVSSFLAGLAGTLVGASVSIAGPYFGIAFGLKGLAVIVLGGLGSIPGAVLGGMVIGIIEALVPADFSAYRDAIAFGILFVMLLVRPQGLLGRQFVQKI
jgi:branched-chain amino acid transport system permease protein